MRCLDRDRRWILVSLYESKKPEVDSFGRYTGRNVVERSEPVGVLCSVSAARGSAQDDIFGTDVAYDRAVIVDDPDFEIDEVAVLWIDDVDGSGAEAPDPGDAPYDYTVERVARTPAYTAVAARRVQKP